MVINNNGGFSPACNCVRMIDIPVNYGDVDGDEIHVGRSSRILGVARSSLDVDLSYACPQFK